MKVGTLQPNLLPRGKGHELVSFTLAFIMQSQEPLHMQDGFLGPSPELL